MTTQTQALPPDRDGRRQANRPSGIQYRTANAARETSNPQLSTTSPKLATTPTGGWKTYNKAVAARLVTGAINEAIASGFVPPRVCGRYV